MNCMAGHLINKGRREKMQDISSIQDTLLIIDDSELNRVILSEIFSGAYHIIEASDGAEGWEKYEKNKEHICAILLDVVMPVMDGMDFLRVMKEHDEMKRIPVFLITASESTEILREAYEIGVMDVISKPVVPYMILRRVNSIIELFSARKKLREKVKQQNSEILKQAEMIIELNQGMIEALSTAIEFRSGESGEHVRRLREITHLMLEKTEFGTGLSGEEVEQISLGAIMHDVGKIAVPDEILNKPGRLTADEYEIMKTHTVKGAEMLSQIPQMKRHASYQYAYDIARYHHERWDGKGYPDGLRENEIPVCAQIVSIADVYDALVSKRVYKDAVGFDRAVGMIQNGECGAFNPRLIEAFLSVEKECRMLYVQNEEADS